MTRAVRNRPMGKTYEHAWDVPGVPGRRLEIRSFLAVLHNKTVVTLNGAPLLELMDADTAGRLRLRLEDREFELRWIVSSNWSEDAFALVEQDRVVASCGNPDGVRRLSDAHFHIEDIRPRGCGLAAVALALLAGAGAALLAQRTP